MGLCASCIFGRFHEADAYYCEKEYCVIGDKKECDMYNNEKPTVLTLNTVIKKLEELVLAELTKSSYTVPVDYIIKLIRELQNV